MLEISDRPSMVAGLPSELEVGFQPSPWCRYRKLIGIEVGSQSEFDATNDGGEVPANLIAKLIPSSERLSSKILRRVSRRRLKRRWSRANPVRVLMLRIEG